MKCTCCAVHGAQLCTWEGGGGVPQCAVGNGLGVLHIGVRI